MSDVKIFLKVLKTEGYPNPNIESIARMVGYNLDEFLLDLKNEIGESGVVDFCRRAIDKLQGEDGIRVDLDGGEFCVIKIKPQYYDEDEAENDVISTSSWGDSRILSTGDEGEETYKTIKQIIDDTDFSGWSEMDELIDHIKLKAYNIVSSNCGFGIWWE